MENHEIKSIQDILINKDVFVKLGWKIEEIESCFLFFKLDIDNISKGFFISQSLKIQSDLTMVGFYGIKQVLEIKLRPLTLIGLESTLDLLSKTVNCIEQVTQQSMNQQEERVPEEPKPEPIEEPKDLKSKKTIRKSRKRFVCKNCKRFLGKDDIDQHMTT